MDNYHNIYAFVRAQEYLYRSGATKISKYVQHSLSETVQTIYAYINSKHISGEQDSLGRDKPFFNIVVAARNIWFRATNLDRKDIRIRETDSDHVISAFIATIKLQDWMRRERFGVFLKDWGLTLAGFGSAITKFVQKDGKLIPAVVPWDKMICDTIDFNNNPKIEIFEYTASQLREKKEYDQDVVEALISSPTIRMTITQELQDVKPYYFKIYEVHGMFPVSNLTKDTPKYKPADKKTYSQQMHVVAYTRTSTDGKYNDFSLFKGQEAKDPYRCDSLLKEDGRTLAIGSVEHLFQSQWMVNHNYKAIKDQLDLASKLIFQTSDPAFVGLNALASIETGQILNHKINEPITAVPNGSADTESLIDVAAQWKAIGQEVNGVTDAMIGIRPSQGTAWRMQNLQLQEAQALFDTMKENKGLALEDMLREWIIPYIKTQLKDSKQIVATLESHNVKKIDSMYVPQEAIKRYNRKIINHVIKTNGKRPIGINLKSELDQVQAEQNSNGNVRYFKPSEITKKTWKQVFDDLEWEAEVIIADESSDDNATLQTLNTALQMVLNPAYATSPQAQMIVGKILQTVSGLSPLELASTPATSSLPATNMSSTQNPSSVSKPKGRGGGGNQQAVASQAGTLIGAN